MSDRNQSMNTKAVDAAADDGSARSDRTSFAARIVALACGLAFLTVGWVWAYLIAVVGWAFGSAGFALLAWARRRDLARGTVLSGSQRALRGAATWTLWLAALVSAIALVATLVAN